MPLSINTNVASLTAQRAMMNSNAGLESAFERLSTGKRINSAADDAAGLAIGKDLESRVSGLNQAIRNANDAISMVQIAEGSLDEATTILQRMRDLSVQAANGSLSSAEQGYLDTEQEKLATALNDVLKQAKFDDITLIDNTATASDDKNSTKTFQIGADSIDTMGVTFQGLSDLSLGVSASDIALNGSGAVETVTFNQFAAKDTQEVTRFNITNFGTNSGNITLILDGTTITGSGDLDNADAAVTLLNGLTGVSDIGVFSKHDTNNLDFKFFSPLDKSGTTSIASTATSFAAANAGVPTEETAGDGVGTTVAGDIYTLTVGSDTFATDAATATSQYNTNKEITDALNAKLVAAGADFSIGTAGGTDNGTITITYSNKGDQTLNNSDYKLEKTTGAVGNDDTAGTQVDGTADASGAIAIIDKALALVADDRARLGAAQSQLESTVRNLANVAENTSAAAGRIMDTDYAAETANLTKAQILQQAATSILAQANAQPQSVLSLLQ